MRNSIVRQLLSVKVLSDAAGGIGFATAKAFAQSGARVVMADINRPGIEKAAEELKNHRFEVLGIECNVANEEEVKRLVEKTVEAFGGLHIAYNNVGIQAPVAKITEADRKRFRPGGSCKFARYMELFEI